MTRYLTEFIGTFFLVLTICLSAGTGSQYAPLAISSSLMVMVYMGGPISGAHYNPAVSIAALLVRKLPGRELVPYLLAQFAGAIAAAAIGGWVLGAPFAPAPTPNASGMKALAIEALYSFALCLVVLNVAMSKRSAGNPYFGLAIGFTIAAAAFAGGGISGGAFNPAVGVGTILVSTVAGGGSFAHAWLYIVGPLLGAVAASQVFAMQESSA